jgi:hypothetical protein
MITPIGRTTSYSYTHVLRSSKWCYVRHVSTLGLGYDFVDGLFTLLAYAEIWVILILVLKCYKRKTLLHGWIAALGNIKIAERYVYLSDKCLLACIHSNYTYCTVPSPTDRTTPLNEPSVSGLVMFGLERRRSRTVLYIATTYTVLGGLRVCWRPLHNKLCFTNSTVQCLCKKTKVFKVFS